MSSEITRIGSYVFETKLARGGFGDIWQARDQDSGKRVAIKILHPELVISEAIVMRFEREANAIAMLQHPNVVALLKFDKLEDNRPYLVMELLHGPNLERRVRDLGALRTPDILGILEQLCSALEAAHEHGIIHRDLKASNVVLDTSRGDERVVLLDFGIVKLLEAGGPELTASRVTLGSPVCMAPEQIQGHDVDPRTDVYALGSLTFLMLTGELPFPGRSMDTMQQHLLSPRPRPSDRMDISPVYDDVVTKAMAKSPSNRFDSVREFLGAFRYAFDLDQTSAASITLPDTSRDSREISVPCIGLYVEVCVDQDVLADADDALLDDMDGIYPRAARYLEQRGFLLAYESGDSALFVLPLPDDEVEHGPARQRAIERAHELFDILAQRDGRDPRLRVCLHLHVDQATLTQGLVTEGPLLDIPAWVVPRDDAGVSLTPAMGHGLELP